jgi:ABC-type multidrug transport system fused ATPase/permease subunit
MSIAGALLAKLQTSLAEKESAAYGAAGAIAEEVLSGIRTVVAFGGQAKELERFAANLAGARSSGILRSVLTGLSSGVTLGVMFGVYGIGFWFGIKLILDDLTGEKCQACPVGDADCLSDCVSHNARDLLTVFMCVLNGYWYLGQSAPFVESFAKARSSARVIYDVIDRKPVIDGDSPAGRILADRLTGPEISLTNVVFTYPARAGVKVLDGLSLTVPSCKTVALVGSSGCGKSTCIQLIQRFYDPQQGAVRVNGVDIRDLIQFFKLNVLDPKMRMEELFAYNVYSSPVLAFAIFDYRKKSRFSTTNKNWKILKGAESGLVAKKYR